jgi:mannose-6-phosphate isomerase
MTISQCHRFHGNRSSRAGTCVSIHSPARISAQPSGARRYPQLLCTSTLIENQNCAFTFRRMPETELTEPLVFAPIFKERIWGGRRLESLYGKRLPRGVSIGESWEIVDRAEAQSVIERGPWSGRTLHEVWENDRRDVFGNIGDAERFPLLIKLLDAEQKLSLQVHPPPHAAAAMGGEPKTEFWFIADAKPGADLYVGMKRGSSRAAFEDAIASGTAEEHVHRVPVKTGDAMFLPSGRVHAIGAGNVIVEIQQNSDTTYRVFDWNRTDDQGAPRELHVEQSLSSIAFDDHEPELVEPAGESMVRDALFHVERWELSDAREAIGRGEFAIVCCLTGAVRNNTTSIKPGEFFLLPATLRDRALHADAPETTLLRITIPRAAAASSR